METLCKGIPVCDGTVIGTVRVINDNTPIVIKSIQEKEILVLPKSNPMYSLLMINASGVICEIGGRLSHLCIIAREIGVPCITQVDKATNILKDGQRILLDATNGYVYATS